MDFNSIEQFSLSKLQQYASVAGIDVDEDSLQDTCILQALLFSYVTSHVLPFPIPNDSIDIFYGQLFELCAFFDQPIDLVELLMESSEGLITSDIIEQLCENSSDKSMQLFVSQSLIVIYSKNTPKPMVMEMDRAIKIFPNSALIFLSNSVNTSSNFITNAFANTTHPYNVLLESLPFGIYKHPSNPMKLFQTSYAYEYVYALDSCNDILHWGWSSHWTEELESSLLTLLVTVNDDLVHALRSMKAMVGNRGEAEFETLIHICKSDIQKALCDHNAYNIGMHACMNMYMYLKC
jgi:hypothetical protein